ncbi:MAG: helix-turn-helix domain-containing protein [Eubacterium sp.]|nr:helix-turn-helix domain-containing protein [Eubacterium sp.]
MQYTSALKSIREDRDLYQKDVAKVLGVSQQYYSQYEKGENELPLRHLITLCKYYNVSADYLLGFTRERKELPKE